MGTYSDPALILPGTVGQTELDAASKKDVASGVAALDAAGALLLPGSKMYFTRDGSDDVHIYERTSDEEAYAFHRVGADDYTFFVKESNVWKRMQTESMKDAANGIAGLDASVEIPVALLKTNVANGIAGLDASVEIPVALLKTNVANGIAGLDAASKVPVANLPDMLPTGTLLPYGAAAAPSGYLLCNGAAVSRTTYAALFGVIGDAYGIGDGSTTFNLPDMVGNVPVGIGASGVTNLGDSGGEQTHTLIIAEMPSHTHKTRNPSGSIESLDSSTHSQGVPNIIDTGATGGDGAHNNMQPYQGVNYIIKL